MKRSTVGKTPAKAFDGRLPVTLCRTFVWTGLILALLVPLVVDVDLYYPFASSKALWFMGVTIPTFAAWTWLSLIDRRYRLELNWVSATLFAYVLSATISALAGPDPVLSIWSKHERFSGLIVHFHLLAFFLILSGFLREKKDWTTLFCIAVAIASLVSVWGIAQTHGIRVVVTLFDALGLVSEGVSKISTGGSTLGNTSFLGSYLQMNAFLAMYLMTGGTGKSRVAVTVALVLILAGIYLNPGGRAMRYALPTGAVVMALLYLSVGSKRVLVRRFAKIALCVAVLAFLALVVALVSGGNPVHERFNSIRGGEVRIQTWKMAWEGVREKPILGWGFENHDLAFYQYFNPKILVGVGKSVQETWYDRAHNVVLDHLLTGGFLGAGLFALVVMVFIFTLWKGVERENPSGLGAFAVFTAMLAAHFLQNLSVFDMLPSYMLLFVLFAYASVKAKPISVFGGGGRAFQATSPVSVVAFVCLGSAGALAFHHFVFKPREAALLATRIAAGAVEGPIEREYAAASEASPVGRHQIRIQLAESAMKRLERFNDIGKDNFYLGEADYVISQLEKSAEESPRNFRIFYTIGQLNAAVAFRISLVGEAGEFNDRAFKYVLASELAYQKAIDLSPRNVLAYWGLSRALIYKGFISGDATAHKNALTIAEYAVEVEPRVFASHDLVVDIAANLIENSELALEKIKRAEEINPRWRGRLMAHVRKAKEN